jgi:pilus assembly protein CpaF
MSFELIIPFLRPIEPLLLDDSISEIMGNPDASWWYERDGIIHREGAVSFDPSRLRTSGKNSTRTIQSCTRNCPTEAAWRL